jgi:hypothetical protein
MTRIVTAKAVPSRWWRMLQIRLAREPKRWTNGALFPEPLQQETLSDNDRNSADNEDAYYNPPIDHLDVIIFSCEGDEIWPGDG